MQQLVKEYIDSIASRVMTDEVKLSQLSQQCEPSASQLSTTSPGTQSLICRASHSFFLLLILSFILSVVDFVH